MPGEAICDELRCMEWCPSLSWRSKRSGSASGGFHSTRHGGVMCVRMDAQASRSILDPIREESKWEKKEARLTLSWCQLGVVGTREVTCASTKGTSTMTTGGTDTSRRATLLPPACRRGGWGLGGSGFGARCACSRGQIGLVITARPVHFGQLQPGAGSSCLPSSLPSWPHPSSCLPCGWQNSPGAAKHSTFLVK